MKKQRAWGVGADAIPSASPTGALLTVEDVEVKYGAVRALKGVSFTVAEHEAVALIGANGAGKSTTQRTVSGQLRPTNGRIYFEGDRIDGTPAHDLVRRGLCHVPEGRHIFPRMTVQENLSMGAYRFSRPDPSLWEWVLELFPVLRDRLREVGGNLSGGEQQMLAIGRALMSKPRLLLLDEPSMGLAPMSVRAVFAALADINASGTTILMVEQNVTAAFRLASRGYVLETGDIVLEGASRDLMADPRVRAAYLGEDIVDYTGGPSIHG